MSLHTAVKNDNIDMVKLLLGQPEYRRQINKYNNQYDTPLIIAVENDNIEMVKLLLKYGADINKHHDSITLLEHAIYKNSTEMVKFLLTYEAKPENEPEVVYIPSFRIVEETPPHTPVQKELPKYTNDA